MQKKQRRLHFTEKKECREFLFACILSHHFLVSLRLTHLATECLTQHMLSLKQKSCGFYAPIFQQLPQPVKRRTFLTDTDIYIRKLPQEALPSQKRYGRMLWSSVTVSNLITTWKEIATTLQQGARNKSTNVTELFLAIKIVTFRMAITF